MRNYFNLILLICLFSISSVHAETYIRDYTYKASEADSKLTSRANALDQVKLILLQEIGTHIRHEMNISKDQTGKTEASEDIEAITAGLTKTEIMEEKWNGETYYLKAKIVADTQKVLNALEEFKNNKTEKNIEQLEELKNSQRQLKAAREEMASLRLQLSQATTIVEKEEIVVKYAKQVDQLSISEMNNKALSFARQKQWSDAAKWFRKSAEQGDPLAQHHLGLINRYGHGHAIDYKQAVHWFRKSAEQGYNHAQRNLADLFKRGEGVTKNNVIAAQWYRKSALQGNKSAQYYLGMLYKNNVPGIKQNFYETSKWFTKAAQQGHQYAQIELGTLFRNGQGVKQNYALAAQWYRKAALQGSSNAQLALGVLYQRNVPGIKQDFHKAKQWITKSAKQGNANAQYKLGGMYSRGEGVKKNNVLAAQWYRKAADQGNKYAQYFLGMLYTKNSPGITRNIKWAKHWLTKSANQDYANAKNQLSKM